MRLWWVVAWDKYYPSAALGNVIATYATEAEAESHKVSTQNQDSYDVVQVINVKDLVL